MSGGGSTASALREGWDAVYHTEGGVGGSIVTQGGVRKGLLLRGEEWEVVVIVNSSG